MESVEKNIAQGIRRLTVQRVLDAVGFGALAAQVGAVGLIVAGRFAGVGWVGVPVVIALLFAGGILGALWGFLTRPSEVRAAVRLDQLLGLDERVVSALAARERSGPIAHAVRRDAAAHLGRIDWRQRFPYRFPPQCRAVAFTAAVAVLLAVFVPVRNQQPVAFSARANKESRAPLDALERWAEEHSGEAFGEPPEVTTLARDLRHLLRTAESRQGIVEGLSHIRKRIESLQTAIEVAGAMPQVATTFDASSETGAIGSLLSSGRYGRAAESVDSLAEEIRRGTVPAERLSDVARGLAELGSTVSGSVGNAFAEASHAIRRGDNTTAADLLNAGAEELFQAQEAATLREKLVGLRRAVDWAIAELTRYASAREHVEPAGVGEGPEANVVAAVAVLSRGEVLRPQHRTEIERAAELGKAETQEMAPAAQPVPLEQRWAVRQYFERLAAGQQQGE